ncbi:MAG: cytochrome C oxidase subunit IV family protein [Gammaproteobacteria bacterium]|nr:cytochrome C oxidase subunit IV family protein [Gammaproteobacteria bacterium]
MKPKKRFAIRPCTRVYLILMLLTSVTYFIGQAKLEGLEIALIVLLLALVKGQLIGHYFMGLGAVKGLWHWPVAIWLLIPGGIISLTFIYA